MNKETMNKIFDTLFDEEELLLTMEDIEEFDIEEEIQTNCFGDLYLVGTRIA